jgi:phosphatidylserine/phosphatidylglycerophosphate/cardiolipin synthase-like enzyme
MKITSNYIAAVALVFALTAGCASAPQQTKNGMNDSRIVAPALDRGYKAKRMVTKGAHLAWVTARSVYENPINRPVSHFGALASYALKSTGGMLRRVAISTVQMPALNDEIPEVSYAEPMDLVTFENILDKTTGTRSDTGKIEFLVDGDEYFCRLTTAVRNAKESVDIRTYIFDNDDYAVEFADILKKKSDDTRVRVMLDGVGNMMAMQADSETMPAGYQGPLSMRMYMERGSDVKVRNITNPWLTTADHTKTTIIDKKIAFVGGMNIGREYRYDWHDLMMEVSGPVVDKLQYESDKAWARASIFGDFANFVAFVKGKKEHAGKDGYPVRILQTRNFDSDIHKAQIAAIQNAQSYILIENAYFSDDQTLYELARARRRGVDVRVIIPGKGNHGALNASNKVTINNLINNGIRVYEYPGMSHVKAAIFDGWISVGSANFDKLSLKINKELNLATSDPDTVQALLDKVFIPDMMASRELNKPVEITVATRLAEIAVDELL